MNSLAEGLTRSQEAAQVGHRYRRASVTTFRAIRPLREWGRDAFDQQFYDYAPRHAMTDLRPTHVMFIGVNGLPRKIRVFAS